MFHATRITRRLLTRWQFQRPISVQAASSGKGVEITTENGKIIHPMWLRDRCLSSFSVQETTRQPLHQPHDFPVDLTIEEANIHGHILDVLFSDGHRSQFRVKSVELEAADLTAIGIQQTKNQLPQPILWTRCPVQRFTYASLKSDYINMDPSKTLELTTRLFTHGHAIISDVPVDNKAVARFAAMLTGFGGDNAVRPTNWGPVFNVRSMPDNSLDDIAYTAQALPPHVDNPYRDPNPGFQLLHVLENECYTTGGSLAVDGFEVASQLREESPELFRVLAETPVRWENDGGDRSTALVYFGPHISIDPTTQRVIQVRYSPKSGGYSPCLDDIEEMDTFFRARRRFAELLNEAKNTVRFRLDKGDLWIFNNLRVLHGRDEFDVNEGVRHFQGCYIDMDGLQSAHFRSKFTMERSMREV